MPFPRARSKQLTIQELPDETLVFDHQHNKARCLNRTTALVWRHCDGRTGLAALARVVGSELGIKQAEPIVQLALEQLASRNLLETPVERGSEEQRRSRRELLKRMAVAALPVILTVAAPRANAAGSKVVSCTGRANGTNCGGSATQVCCSNTCTNTNTDPNNCGSCGQACLLPEATGCKNGGCCIPTGQPCIAIPFPCCSGSCQAGVCA